MLKLRLGFGLDNAVLEQRFDLVAKSDDAEKRSVLCEDRTVKQERIVGGRLHEAQRRGARDLARIARLPDRREPFRKRAGIDAEHAAVSLRRDVDDRIKRAVEFCRIDRGAVRSDETRLRDTRLRERADRILRALGFYFGQPADGRDFRRQRDDLVAVFSERPRGRKRRRHE